MLWQLFFEYFKTGLFAVGGGLATLPFVYRMADKFPWLSYAQIADMIAVSESTPGPIGVNLATYTGFRCAGILGSAVATFALVLPSIVIILAIARVLEAFKKNETVKAVFKGLRPAATGLIAAAGFGVVKLALYDDAATDWYGILKWRELILFVAVFAAIRLFKKHPIVYIAAAGAIGIAIGL